MKPCLPVLADTKHALCLRWIYGPCSVGARTLRTRQTVADQRKRRTAAGSSICTMAQTSGIVTMRLSSSRPIGCHSGEDKAILKQRETLYQATNEAHPERWSGKLRNRQRVDEVWLNPPKEHQTPADHKSKAT